MQDQNLQRAAIWSVREKAWGLFFVLFSIQFIALATIITWHEINSNTQGSWPDVIIAIGRGLGSWVLVIAAESIIISESMMFLSERYIMRRYLQGRAEGKAETFREWEEWNRRREAAAAAGEPFTEPPPSLNGQKP